MQIIRDIADRAPEIAGSVVTIGNFDGIHLGHQALIGGAVGDARRLSIPSVVLTFEPHPLKVLAPVRAPKLILTYQDKIQLLEDLGVDIAVVQKFDLGFATVSAQEFVRNLLRGRLKVRKLWVGKDLRFGQGRKGKVEDLLEWSAALDFGVEVVEPISVNSNRVSSSRIREFVDAGRVDEVKPMLGRYHFISGQVIGGQRRGRELGFPTANLAVRTEVLPRDGIYATLFHLGDRNLPSVTSIGVNPTFGAGPRTVEAFILNFNDDVYGEDVRLSFISRIREEKKFDSVSELVAQIRDDVQCAETMFRKMEIKPPIIPSSP